MTISFAIFLCLVLMITCSAVLYQVAKRQQREQLIKFIPAAATLVGIIFFTYKLYFISQQYEGIFDIVAIIFLTVLTGIFLLTASIGEWFEKRGRA